jgi:hypothetical protein
MIDMFGVEILKRCRDIIHIFGSIRDFDIYASMWLEKLAEAP